ncbi:MULTISPECIES: helix-turn-helix transcriptional regulator [Acinetobacter]|uniref:XRE family transcriptional regulator n=1 Tax=Acinetobacter haemolyticus TaxID=29430 RepID=A0A6L9E616_ACIHA|nr:helix-turn-helix transcriptional regulator [Acinetobacter haemolyticus]NAR61992.1 helix-turn-helix domain-containing protein [Acinetobacter haemolyticus]NAR67961.1 helix-turn-helix domain-containing protein [Acinetobacter haemolyticus]NAR71428.1 helix-turn-helix domain-containing protein [Acinetobacter haemolyticus]NAR84437.1 helix-turn-helix domain-containing protein [Acinetobacter haemolyticus]NAR86729.1 helix-turn-helix domain-containing protein [Acinetobacter haemolyticus]
MDLKFKKSEEVVTLLCERLRKERLYLEMTQSDVATRAGVSMNTVSNLEAGRNVSFENLVRVAMVLGRLKELEELFKPDLNSVDDILRYESNTARQRIKRK